MKEMLYEAQEQAPSSEGKTCKEYIPLHVPHKLVKM